MKFLQIAYALAALMLFGFYLAYVAASDKTEPLASKDGFDMSTVERGRYLSVTSGCNDCHTPGYLLNEGKIPMKLWLTGDSFGWRGPWGTTYASNLRLLMDGLSEQEWIDMARTLKRRPPMPWFNVNIMHEDDLRAIYQFVRYLGPGGEPAPAYVSPDLEPKGPYALFPSPPKEISE
jgi:mono/diheme cytochrome c family protein